MYDAFTRGWTAWLVGSATVGASSSLLAFAAWWALSRERMSWASLALRALLGLLACAGLLAGMVVLGVGTETLLGDPLGRWGGASMVPALWVTLEIHARDAALIAALASRDLDTELPWIYARLVWLGSWAAMALGGLVAVWAMLGA